MVRSQRHATCYYVDLFDEATSSLMNSTSLATDNMIEAEEEDIAAASFTNKVELMEQEDGEVSDLSDCDDTNDDEGEVLEQKPSRTGHKGVITPTKTDANTSKKTALEKLKNMSFSSRSKLLVRRTTAQQHSPCRDNDEERRQRKRRWEERNDEQERHQMHTEERPRPLREAVAVAHSAPLPVISRPIEPARPVDQPLTLRQRVEKVIVVQENEAVSMSGTELRNLIARMCDLSKEQQRLLRGRQAQFETLREIYVEVKEDIEKLCIRVPTHMRMDLLLPTQTLPPSASSSSGSLQMNGGTVAFHLEQRFRLPTLLEPSYMVAGANAQSNSGNDSEVNVRNEERCAGGRVGFGEVGNVSSDPQRLLTSRNGTVYGGGLNEHGLHEDMSRIGVGSSGTMLRNESRSNKPNVMDCTPHASFSSDQALHSVNNTRPLFSGLNGPGHVDQSASVIPSTSTCDSASNPHFSGRDLGEGNSRFSGSGSSLELFPKVATDPSVQVDSFSDRPASLMNFGNAGSPNQASHSIGRQIYDTVDKSSSTTYTSVQTNVSKELEPGENDSGSRATNQHCFVHALSQYANSFIQQSKPPSPRPTHHDFSPHVPLRTVTNSTNTDSAHRNTYHEHLIHFKSNEVPSSSQVPLPNLSEPPPPFGTAHINNPPILPSTLSSTMLLNTLQSPNMAPPQSAPALVGVSASPYPSEHAVASIQQIPATGTSSMLNALPTSSTPQNVPTQPGSTAAVGASSLISLHSGSATVSVPPPDFSVPPPVAPSLTARTSVGAPAITTSLTSQSESTSPAALRTGPSSNVPIRRGSSDVKGGVLPNHGVLGGLPSMNVPPPSFSVPPPRAPNAGSSFPTPPSMTPVGLTSGPRSANLAPSPNLMSGSVALNCPPPDMSQPPPNMRNPLGGNNPEGVQQMVSAMVSQSAVTGQTPVEVVTELIASAYSRAGGVRLHHDVSLKQRMSMAMESTTMISKMRAPAPAGPPRPLSSVGKLPPPLMLSPSARGSPASRNVSFNKRKGSQIRSSLSRPQQRQKRQISDMVAIIPDEHDHPSSREEPDDNIFLIVSDEEDGNK